MLNYIKADLFRMQKEKTGWISQGLVTIMIGIFAYFLRDSQSEIVGLMMQFISLFIVLSFTIPISYFWGSDFQHRTIHHLISKVPNRLYLFIYKILGSLLFATLYAFYTVIVMSVSIFIFSGQFEVVNLFTILGEQAPFYMAIIMLLIFLFNLFSNMTLPIIIYIVYVLSLEQLILLLLGYLTKMDFFRDIGLVENLQVVLEKGTSLEQNVIALAYILIFLGLSGILFQKRAIK